MRHTTHLLWAIPRLAKSLRQYLASNNLRRLRIRHNQCNHLRCFITSRVQAPCPVHRFTEVPRACTVKVDFQEWLSGRCIQCLAIINLPLILCHKHLSLAYQAGHQLEDNSSNNNREVGPATSFQSPAASERHHAKVLQKFAYVTPIISTASWRPAGSR